MEFKTEIKITSKDLSPLNRLDAGHCIVQPIGCFNVFITQYIVAVTSTEIKLTIAEAIDLASFCLPEDHGNLIAIDELEGEHAE